VPIYPIYWQLEYPGGTYRTEPPEGETILHAPKGYTALLLVDLVGLPVQRIEIPQGARAIFYRNRSAGMGDNEPTLDATVFGYGNVDVLSTKPHPSGVEVKGNFQTRLWVWNPYSKKPDSCPQRLVAEGAITHLLTFPVGT
jgi:hypothetical protein